jgi:hypothetical protein
MMMMVVTIEEERRVCQANKTSTVDLTQSESFSVENLPEKRTKYITFTGLFTS